jgi:multidrug efflux pump subunit AcrA (membrane-fusion protein)
MNKVEKNDLDLFTSPKEEKIPSWARVFARILITFLGFSIIVLSVAPWQQTSKGVGVVSALDPNNRIQDVTSNLKGRINKWLVRDGTVVKKGDPLVEIVDNDPNLIDRLTGERDSTYKSFEASRAAAETSLLNYKRQKSLFEDGLTSRLSLEKAKIEYKKYLSSEAGYAVKLAQTEVKLSRQQSQMVTAPRDGTVLKIYYGSGSVFVKEGDKLASFVPETSETAIEVYISGNDLPLVYPGREVRIQFEGWPAIQFSGWPSVAVGTFGGVVSNVDASASKDGKFRVIVVPEKDNDWPDTNFLRQGTRVVGWITLNTVTLGYEIWRQFNGFPPSLENSPSEYKNESK